MPIMIGYDTGCKKGALLGLFNKMKSFVTLMRGTAWLQMAWEL